MSGFHRHMTASIYVDLTEDEAIKEGLSCLVHGDANGQAGAAGSSHPHRQWESTPRSRALTSEPLTLRKPGHDQTPGPATSDNEVDLGKAPRLEHADLSPRSVLKQQTLQRCASNGIASMAHKTQAGEAQATPLQAGALQASPATVGAASHGQGKSLQRHEPMAARQANGDSGAAGPARIEAATPGRTQGAADAAKPRCGHSGALAPARSMDMGKAGAEGAAGIHPSLKKLRLSQNLEHGGGAGAQHMGPAVSAAAAAAAGGAGPVFESGDEGEQRPLRAAQRPLAAAQLADPWKPDPHGRGVAAARQPQAACGAPPGAADAELQAGAADANASVAADEEMAAALAAAEAAAAAAARARPCRAAKAAAAERIRAAAAAPRPQASQKTQHSRGGSASAATGGRSVAACGRGRRGGSAVDGPHASDDEGDAEGALEDDARGGRGQGLAGEEQPRPSFALMEELARERFRRGGLEASRAAPKGHGLALLSNVPDRLCNAGRGSRRAPDQGKDAGGADRDADGPEKGAGPSGRGPGPGAVDAGSQDDVLVCSMLMHGKAASLFRAARRAALEGTLERDLEKQELIAVHVVDGEATSEAQVAAVEKWLEACLREGAWQEMKAAGDVDAKRKTPGQLTKRQILRYLPKTLPLNKDVGLARITRERAGIWEGCEPLMGQLTLKARRKGLAPCTVIGVYAAEMWLEPDLNEAAAQLPEWTQEAGAPRPWDCTFAWKHDLDRYSADAAVPGTLLEHIGEGRLHLPPDLQGLGLGTEGSLYHKFAVSSARLGNEVSCANDPRRDPYTRGSKDYYGGPPNAQVIAVEVLGILPLLIMVTEDKKRIAAEEDITYGYGDGYWKIHHENEMHLRDARAAMARAAEAERERAQQAEARLRAEWEAAQQTAARERAEREGAAAAAAANAEALARENEELRMRVEALLAAQARRQAEPGPAAPGHRAATTQRPAGSGGSAGGSGGHIARPRASSGSALPAAPRPDPIPGCHDHYDDADDADMRSASSQAASAESFDEADEQAGLYGSNSQNGRQRGLYGRPAASDGAASSGAASAAGPGGPALGADGELEPGEVGWRGGRWGELYDTSDIPAAAVPAAPSPGALAGPGAAPAALITAASRPAPAAAAAATPPGAGFRSPAGQATATAAFVSAACSPAAGSPCSAGGAQHQPPLAVPVGVRGGGGGTPYPRPAPQLASPETIDLVDDAEEAGCGSGRSGGETGLGGGARAAGRTAARTSRGRREEDRFYDAVSDGDDNGAPSPAPRAAIPHLHPPFLHSWRGIDPGGPAGYGPGAHTAAGRGRGPVFPGVSGPGAGGVGGHPAAHAGLGCAAGGRAAPAATASAPGHQRGIPGAWGGAASAQPAATHAHAARAHAADAGAAAAAAQLSPPSSGRAAAGSRSRLSLRAAAERRAARAAAEAAQAGQAQVATVAASAVQSAAQAAAVAAEPVGSGSHGSGPLPPAAPPREVGGAAGARGFATACRPGAEEVAPAAAGGGGGGHFPTPRAGRAAGGPREVIDLVSDDEGDVGEGGARPVGAAGAPLGTGKAACPHGEAGGCGRVRQQTAPGPANGGRGTAPSGGGTALPGGCQGAAAAAAAAQQRQPQGTLQRPRTSEPVVGRAAHAPYGGGAYGGPAALDALAAAGPAAVAAGHARAAPMPRAAHVAAAATVPLPGDAPAPGAAGGAAAAGPGAAGGRAQGAR